MRSIVILRKLGGLGWFFWRNHEQDDFDKVFARRIRKAFEDLGPTFLKLAQVMSMRPDYIPRVYCEEFEKCLDQAPEIDAEIVCGIVEKELGKPVNEIFKRFDRESLAAASISQVHRAQTQEGDEVVVKVLRPGVKKIIKADIKFLKKLARMAGRHSHLSKFGKNHWIDLINNLEKWLEAETDYRNEVENMDNMRREMVQIEDFAIPQVYEDLSTREVLVLEFFDGWSILEVMRICRRGESDKLPFDEREKVLRIVEVMGTRALERHYFHGDIHPANIIILKDGRIGIIDFGLVEFFDDFLVEGTIMFMLAAVFASADLFLRSADLMGEKIEGLYDERKARYALEKVCLNYKNQTASEVSNAQFLMGVIELCMVQGVKFNWQLLVYTRSAMSLDGMILAVAPDYVFSSENQKIMTEVYLKNHLEKKFAPANILNMVDKMGHDLERVPQAINKLLDKILAS